MKFWIFIKDNNLRNKYNNILLNKDKEKLLITKLDFKAFLETI